MNSFVNTVLCMIMGDGSIKCENIRFQIINKILFKSNKIYILQLPLSRIQ